MTFVLTLVVQLVNSTRRTHTRITQLGSRVMDNAQMTSELQLTLRGYQMLSERQYRLLQTHVIRLNNSLQDLQEDVGNLVHRNVSPLAFSISVCRLPFSLLSVRLVSPLVFSVSVSFTVQSSFCPSRKFKALLSVCLVSP